MVSSLPHSTTTEPSSFEQAASLLVEVLFQANSKPLHRQLVAWCRQLPKAKLASVGHTLVALIEDAVTRSMQPGSAIVQPVHIAEPLLSLLDAQPLQPYLRYGQHIHTHTCVDSLPQPNAGVASESLHCMQCLPCTDLLANFTAGVLHPCMRTHTHGTTLCCSPAYVISAKYEGNAELAMMSHNTLLRSPAEAQTPQPKTLILKQAHSHTQVSRQRSACHLMSDPCQHHSAYLQDMCTSSSQCTVSRGPDDSPRGGIRSTHSAFSHAQCSGRHCSNLRLPAAARHLPGSSCRSRPACYMCCITSYDCVPTGIANAHCRYSHSFFVQSALLIVHIIILKLAFCLTKGHNLFSDCLCVRLICKRPVPLDSAAHIAGMCQSWCKFVQVSKMVSNHLEQKDSCAAISLQQVLPPVQLTAIWVPTTLPILVLRLVV